jgi:hypothetical protein
MVVEFSTLVAHIFSTISNLITKLFFIYIQQIQTNDPAAAKNFFRAIIGFESIPDSLKNFS